MDIHGEKRTNKTQNELLRIERTFTYAAKKSYILREGN